MLPDFLGIFFSSKICVGLERLCDSQGKTQISSRQKRRKKKKKISPYLGNLRKNLFN